MKNNGIILTQGYKKIAIVSTLAMVLVILDFNFLANLLFAISLFLIFIYRNPSKAICSCQKDVILSPVDGVVTAIDNINGEYKVYIKVNLCNYHIVKAPINSSLEIVNHQFGENLNPNSYKGKLLNEQVKFKFNGFTLELISGICNSTIEFTKEKLVRQGDSIAIFLDGIAIITLKNDKELSLKIGDKVHSAQSSII